MTLYEVVPDDGDELIIRYGLFYTYEKAKELMKMFEGLDGFGICEDELCIREVEIVPDRIEDWVLDLIESGKQRKKKYYEEQ